MSTTASANQAMRISKAMRNLVTIVESEGENLTAFTLRNFMTQMSTLGVQAQSLAVDLQTKEAAFSGHIAQVDAAIAREYPGNRENSILVSMAGIMAVGQQIADEYWTNVVPNITGPQWTASTPVGDEPRNHVDIPINSSTTATIRGLITTLKSHLDSVIL